jgi:hypothetical protein
LEHRSPSLGLSLHVSIVESLCQVGGPYEDMTPL